MGSNIKCSIVIISLIFQVAFGCRYAEINCTFKVYCSGDDYISLDRIIYNNGYGSYCTNVRNYDGYNFIPVEIYVRNLVNVAKKLPPYNHDIILRAPIAIDISNNNLQVTPTLYAMDNLKVVNLSNNHLQVANLFNEVELIKLQDIDLSHNFISLIQVDDDQHVYKNLRKINLSHNVLTDISGAIFYSFKYLETLDLSYNNLATIDHYTFEGLKSLKYLYLSHNSITDINSSFFRFVYLEELYLDNNDIEYLLPRDFEKLERLQILNLDFNKISRIEKDTFNGTVSLMTVKLHHNLLIYISKDAFTSTINLKAVDLSNNLLKTLPKDLFRNKIISSFSITGNNLEGVLSRDIFEGIHVPELDISFQEITAIEDYAFFGLEQLTVLLLNNNKIHTISKQAFNSLKYLYKLDLSSNFITNLDFDTTDLFSLQTIYLGKNFIEQIRHDNFRDFKKLHFLDLSNNNITTLEPNSFISAEALESFQIFHNPLNGSLLKDTFKGLSSVPVLDLSCTLLTTIQNGSFCDMVQMQDLNVSRSLINTLEYDAFMNTGNLKLIDLSYNKLTDFFVNTNDIRNLTTIFLNNNRLIHISNDCFKDMSLLNKIIISHNYLKNIEHEAFANQMDLNYLDVSFNSNLTFHISVINYLRNLEKLILSSTKSEIDFTNIGSVCLKYLEISHLRINVSKMHFNALIYLTDLVLTKDNIVEIDLNVFRNLSVLERLDLSYNNISFIQPGSFKDNVALNKLNLSHNFLTTLNYGLFRGLASLTVLDVSFNSIHDLKRERFYDLPNINTLFIDHNRITDVDNDFFEMNLGLLSIGNNPLPCEKIVHMKRENVNVDAISIDEHNGDNIDGIICNMYKNSPKIKVSANDSKDYDKILLDIKEILQNLSMKNQNIKLPPESRDSELLKNILDKIDKYGTDQIQGEIQLKNITTQLSHISQLTRVTDEVDRTNSFLERILKAIIGLGPLQGKSVVVPTKEITTNKNNESLPEDNAKLNDLITDVSQVKHELLYLENVISEIDRKISVGGTLNKPLESGKVNTSDVLGDRNTGKSLVFVEVCVSLILIILVCFFLYKFYQSKMFVSNSRSLSTRHITDAMDNSNL
ncbi:uncharacterized protein [Epargyreus clarus]|uniref:uncharacterized protein n=1 Tax=Epargyreus clarus TaxID=520877 RepID=UPI003C2EB34B